MRQLNKLLFDERPRDWSGTVPFLLHGTPGVGKTQIAREYAFANSERFKGGVFWVPAQSKELIFHNLDVMLQRLAIWGKPGDLIRSVSTWLGQRRNLLLVFDGLSAEENGDIAEFSKVVPESNDSSIIYVARSRTFPTLHWPVTLKIEPLGKEASRRLLFKELNPDTLNERQKAKGTEIVDSVGRLPLAINAISRRLADTNQPLEEFELSVFLSYEPREHISEDSGRSPTRRSHRGLGLTSNYLLFRTKPAWKDVIVWSREPKRHQCEGI